MLKLIAAIAEDEDDVWNTAARCVLARPAPADPDPERGGFCEQCNDPLSAEERDCYSGDLVFCSPECREEHWANL